MRLVIDNNLHISSLFSPMGPPAQVILLCIEHYVGLRSSETRAELDRKLNEPKFTARFPPAVLAEVERTFIDFFVHVEVDTVITACRDPKDDKFLALALDGQADVIVTGDQDLLILHPWRGIPVLSPRDFLDTLL